MKLPVLAFALVASLFAGALVAPPAHACGPYPPAAAEDDEIDLDGLFPEKVAERFFAARGGERTLVHQDMPDGLLDLLIYESERDGVIWIETLMLEKDPQYIWHVIGYQAAARINRPRS